MSTTPETGSMEAQIQAAKDRINEGAPIPMTAKSEATVEMIARYLVPPGYGIYTPEDRAAIARAIDAVEAGKSAIYTDNEGRVWWACDADEHAAEMSNITDDDLARLKALVQQ